ncbi:MAG: 4Fe-4S dicluster domain-containing protein [Firmicutes bacterium]|nr:4Fe-4S dicluster domain-containing protein [Bacillota bacterium]
MPSHELDLNRCTRCGICAAVCPTEVIRQDEAKEVLILQERAATCFQCGHCMAVCPAQAILVEGLSYDHDLFGLAKDALDADRFMDFIWSRRSVRVFKDKPVPREILERIVEAISFAPMGFPPHKTELTVVQDRSTVRQALTQLIDFYDQLDRWLDNPVSRSMLRLRAGAETFKTLKGHVQPLMKDRLPGLKSGERDTITRGAPAMILFHADRMAEHHLIDLPIAMTYGLLAAHAMGLGACANSLIPPAVNKNRALREVLKLPENQEVVCSILVGYPRYRWQRGIRRGLKNVNWV